MAGATYRYWRIYVTEVDGSTEFASFSEVEFFGAVGGPDLTTGLGGSVTQSGDNAVGGASSAVDNSIGSEAGSSFPLPYWWRIDFGTPTYIDYITIRAQRIVPNRSPKSFIVQGSNDAASWTDVTAFGPSTGWVEYEQRIFILDVPAFVVSGVVTNDSGAPAARTVRVYRRDTGALLGETTSNGTTGAYSFTSTHSGEVQVVCLDDSAGTVYNDLILRATPT